MTFYLSSAESFLTLFLVDPNGKVWFRLRLEGGSGTLGMDFFKGSIDFKNFIESEMSFTRAITRNEFTALIGQNLVETAMTLQNIMNQFSTPNPETHG